jgi:outer membrane PBP1 activator LpoA protein
MIEAARTIVACFTASLVCSATLHAQRPAEPVAQNTDRIVRTDTAMRVVLLLPTEQPLLRRAANTVRDGIRSAANKSGVAIEFRDCGYGVDQVVQAYRRCVTENVQAVIGPLGRSDVSVLVAAETKLDVLRPTLMLSPLGSTPPNGFYVLAPELESEAETIAKQSLEDACRKPVLIETTGAMATRISVAITAYYRSGGVSTPLAQFELGARDRWQRITDSWRRDGVDCVLFAGSSATLAELRPFLRNLTTYITSASYENELDRLMDWTGVRVADAPFILDVLRADFANVAPVETLSPTLARLFALGVDAARISFQAMDPTTANRFTPPERFDGAIGQLRMKDGQYQRTPSVGEFRGRIPVALGL